MSKTIFEEEQQFRQWWLWVLMAIAIGLSVFDKINDDSGFTLETMWPFSIIVLVVLLLFSAKLSTRIDEKGIHVKFFPFHLSFNTYTWEDINQAKVTSYSPIGDYGGWGVRISFRGKGKAFNVCGDQGIYFETFSGKKRMIGTQKAEEAKQVLSNYQKTNS